MIYIFLAMQLLLVILLFVINIDLTHENSEQKKMIDELNEDNDGLCRENLNLIYRLNEKSKQ